EVQATLVTADDGESQAGAAGCRVGCLDDRRAAFAAAQEALGLVPLDAGLDGLGQQEGGVDHPSTSFSRWAREYTPGGQTGSMGKPLAAMRGPQSRKRRYN